MAMKPLSKAIGLAAMAMSGVVLADAPTLKQVLDASGITATGYVDAAYIHYNNDTPSAINYFDKNQNTFDLKQVGLTIASQPKEGFGALVNITGGSDADNIHSYGGSKSNLDITQAFVQYASGPFTAIAGKFNTLAGAEVIAPTGNTNITRSIGFLNAIPFTHTGVRLAVAPMDTLTLYAGLNNGWDQQKDSNTTKTLELGLAWAPVSELSWTAQIYNGKEHTVLDNTANNFLTSPNTNRFLFDTVLTYKPLDALSFVINYDYGKQEDYNGSDDAKWTDITGYINYAFTSEWHMSLRLEQFNDEDDYKLALVDLSDPLTPSKKTKEVTLTVGYAPSANFEVRGEVRQDKADKDAFVKNSTDGSVTDKQTIVALEAYYKF